MTSPYIQFSIDNYFKQSIMSALRVWEEMDEEVTTSKAIHMNSNVLNIHTLL